MQIIFAPAFFARSGMISGMGFDIANTIASLFMDAIISSVTMPGADTPMNTSALSMASFSVPVRLVLFVSSLISFFAGLRSVLSFDIMPRLSHRMMSPAPSPVSIFVTAVPAAPAPLMAIFRSCMFFLVIFKALMRPAATTIAVPCWSSWNTGMSSCSFRRFSISKHLGADMSSRFMPPNTGAISFTVLIIVSVSCESMQIGNASTSANLLKRTHLPSMTGMAALAPMFPRPRTAEPSETTATRWPFEV